MNTASQDRNYWLLGFENSKFMIQEI